jgi:phosphotransferase system HPr-like phosphotransfer protein
MIRKTAHRLILTIPGGLGVTNASLLVTTIKRCESFVTIEYKGRTCAGTDLRELLAMNIEDGDLVSITAAGKDSEEVLNCIDGLFHEDFQYDFNHVYSSTFQKAIA